MNRIYSYIFKEPAYNRKELYHSLRKLTDIFIENKSENYFDKEKNIYSYLYYFYPQNMYKSLFIFDELNRTKFFHKFRNRPINIADIGAGLSPSIMSLFVFLHKEKLTLNRLNINLVEKSSTALKHAKDLLTVGKKLYSIRNAHIYYNKTSLKRFIENVGDNQYDLIILSNSYKEFIKDSEDLSFINEISTALTEDGVLVLIEPGTKSDSLALIRLRNYILSKGKLSLFSPCLGSENCKLAEQNSEWCHVTRGWEPPELTKDLGNMLKRDYKTVKFSYLIFVKKRLTLINYIDKHYNHEKSWNIFTELKKEKGKIVVKGCRDGVITVFEMLDKNRSELNRDFLKLISHNYMCIENYTILKNGNIRVESDTKVKIIY